MWEGEAPTRIEEAFHFLLVAAGHSVVIGAVLFDRDLNLQVFAKWADNVLSLLVKVDTKAILRKYRCPLFRETK